MKQLTCNVLTFILSIALTVSTSFAQLKTPRPSPGAVITQTVGITDITMKYSRPGVKGRVIWGGLVPYDSVWRTGANEATTITVGDTVKVEGNVLPPGTYGVATIPGRTEWTIIFNKESDLWGTEGYKKEKDALRIAVKPQESTDHQEWMRFSIEDLSESSCQVVLSWEKLRIAFKVEIETQALVLASARELVSWRPPMEAANYALGRKTNLDEALKWIDISLSIAETYRNLAVKAQLLAETGKKKDAIKLMEKAVAKGKAMDEPPFDLAQMEQKLNDWKK